MRIDFRELVSILCCNSREGGADPNFVDGQQRNALMYAIKLNDVSMAKLLLNYDYDIKEDKFNSVISGCLPSPEATQREEEEIKTYVKTSPVDLGHQVRGVCVDFALSRSRWGIMSEL